MDTIVIPDLRERVVFSPGGPRPQVLLDSGALKALVAGLEPGQRIPAHPEKLSMYYIIDGTGWMTVDGERHRVGPGVTLFVREGGVRGLEAETRLIFLATRVG